MSDAEAGQNIERSQHTLSKEAFLLNKRTKKRADPLYPDGAEPAVSAGELTGLIPALPQDDEQAAAYRALCPIPRQQTDVRKPH